MTLLDSLLDAIIRLDGDSLVMHVGEKPYVVTTSSAMNALRGPLAWGQVELSSRPLTPDAVSGMLAQILPPEQRQMLDEIGAVELELAAPDAGLPFLITAAKGGDDVWVEVRRKPQPLPAVVEEPAPVPFEAPPAAEEPAAIAIEAPPVEEPAPVPVEAPPAEEEPVVMGADAAIVEEPAAAIEEAPAASEPPIGAAPAEEPAFEIAAEEPAFEIAAEEPAFEIAVEEPQIEISAEEPHIEIAAEEQPPQVLAAEPEEVHEIDMPSSLEWAPGTASFEIVSEDSEQERNEPAVELVEEPVIQLLESDPAVEIVEETPSWDEIPLPAAAAAPPEPSPTVVSIAKPALKLQPPPPAAEAPAASTEASLVALLKVAAARRASTLYAVADSRPMARIDGEVALLGTEAAVTAAEVDRFTFEFAPRDHVADITPEWTCSVKGIGRVRCVTFHDDSGSGLIFHLPSANVSTADELGLEARVQALCGEADGLVIIAGPRGSGKSTMLDAFVDLINRTRYDHVITIESHIRTAHEKRHSFISQRQSDPAGEAIAAAARAALREGPDVLVIEDLRAPEALSVALDAARAGRLVFGGIAAPSASAAVERLVGAFPGDRRPQVRALLATSMRAVVCQVLVRKSNGGRIGARELLLNSPAVEKLILDGAVSQLPLAIEGGRRLGMVTMNDALGTLVRDGSVEVAEACRVAADRGGLIAALERDGVDVSNVERRA